MQRFELSNFFFFSYGLLKLAFRARKLSGALEKRAPVLVYLQHFYASDWRTVHDAFHPAVPCGHFTVFLSENKTCKTFCNTGQRKTLRRNFKVLKI